MLATMIRLGLLAAAGYLVWRRVRPKDAPATEAETDRAAGPPIERLTPVVEDAPPPAPATERLAAAPAAADSGADDSAVEGYCMRCKERRTMSGARIEMTENGRRAARGTCPVCGATMFKFLPMEGA